MIDFDDVRKTPEPTYFFFSRYRRQALVFGLRSAGVTNYEIIKVPEALKRLPADFQVPEVYISPDDPEIETAIRVLVSNYDTNDLETKLGHIELSREFRGYLAEQGKKIIAQRQSQGHDDEEGMY